MNSRKLWPYRVKQICSSEDDRRFQEDDIVWGYPEGRHLVIPNGRFTPYRLNYGFVEEIPAFIVKAISRNAISELIEKMTKENEA